HAKKLINLGEKHEIYILPKGQDWDDLLRANKINKRFMEDCKHRGKLLMAKTVEEYTYHKYCRNSAKRFVITFKNRLFSVCIDIAQLTEDLAGIPLEDKDSFPVFISHCTVMEICNRDPQCLYREVDELLGEQWYVFKIQSTSKKPEIVRLEGSNIATADAFHKALLNRTAGGTFSGTPADMRILTNRWLQNELSTVRSIPYIGYDNESQAYIYPAAAFYKGKEIRLDENSFYRVGKDLVRPGLKSIKIITDGKFTPDWFDKFLKTFHWQGLALLAFWTGSLFAHQIRKEQKSFPFFELTGDPGAGKSTMLEFCWKLLGREDYEGFDVMKSTIAGRRRAFNQVSNMPIVIIESDRETGGKDSKQKQFNFDECKPFYNGRGTGTLGVPKRNNDVEESLFQASLIISQNAQVDGSEALLQRIVHCHADKTHYDSGSRELARFFEKISCDEVSGFLKTALINEAKILKTYFESFKKIETAFSASLKNERIAKNHAQVAACGYALQIIFPAISTETIENFKLYILQRATLREKRLLADHPLVEQFWETFRYLNSETRSTEGEALNHSGNPAYYAINLNHFVQQCRDNGQEMPDLKVLKKLLPHSKKHKLLHKSKAMTSIITNKTVRCWVFKV
uniref:hypothetical protein n=1 Tax=Maridesulfovibrio frigidus TaxID=340956 RepID=UPI0004E20A2F